MLGSEVGVPEVATVMLCLLAEKYLITVVEAPAFMRGEERFSAL
jgi:hypothetical protein